MNSSVAMSAVPARPRRSRCTYRRRRTRKAVKRSTPSPRSPPPSPPAAVAAPASRRCTNNRRRHPLFGRSWDPRFDHSRTQTRGSERRGRRSVSPSRLRCGSRGGGEGSCCVCLCVVSMCVSRRWVKGTCHALTHSVVNRTELILQLPLACLRVRLRCLCVLAFSLVASSPLRSPESIDGFRRRSFHVPVSLE